MKAGAGAGGGRTGTTGTGGIAPPSRGPTGAAAGTGRPSSAAMSAAVSAHSSVASKRRTYAVESLFDCALRGIRTAPTAALSRWSEAQAMYDVLAKHPAMPPRALQIKQIKHAVLRAAVKTGFLEDDSLPIDFFDPGLTEIDLAGCVKITEVFLEALTKRCLGLRKLSLGGCHEVGDPATAVVLRSARRLEEIDLRACRRISDATLDDLGEHTPRLRTLDVGGCFNLTAEGFVRLATNHRNAANFEELYLSGVLFNDAQLTEVAKACPRLEKLSLGYMEQVTAVGIAALVEHCKSLRKLDLHWGADNIDDYVLDALEQCRTLEALNLCGCQKLTNLAIRALAARMSPLRQSAKTVETGGDTEQRNLLHLDVRYTTMMPDTEDYIRDNHPLLSLKSST